jgi:hypothetical protein
VANRCTRWCTYYTLLRVIDREREREKGEEEKRRGEKRGKELRMSLCLLRH